MTAPARQPAVDTPVPCHYAADPARRPRCTLTAAVRVGAIPLCRPCLAAASTLGKGEPAIPLRPGPPTGALDQITAAGQQLAAAQAGPAPHRALRSRARTASILTTKRNSFWAPVNILALINSGGYIWYICAGGRLRHLEYCDLALAFGGGWRPIPASSLAAP